MADFSNIIQEINFNLPDNTEQLITAEILRDTLIDFVNAVDSNEDTIEFSITGKADKVQNAIADNFAGLDENGNLTDSGSKASDFATPSDIDTALENYTQTFVCDYGVTTFADIKDAYNSGKRVILDRRGRIYELSFISPSRECRFFMIQANNTNHIVITKITVTSNNEWSQEDLRLENLLDKVSTIVGNENNETKYPNTKAVADALGKWGVISQTQTWTQASDGGYDYTMSDLVYGIIPYSFIAIMKGVDVVFNETTGYFEKNGLVDLSMEEVSVMYGEYSAADFREFTRLYGSTVSRTNIYPKWMDKETEGFNNKANNLSFTNGLAFSNLEIVYFPKTVGNTIPTFSSLSSFAYKSRYLRVILNPFKFSGNMSDLGFDGCSNLEYIQINSIMVSINFRWSPRLSLASVVYMVENAANTSAITITLHADALARCTADTTEYTYNNNTYTGIVALATAKNITLASA